MNIQLSFIRPSPNPIRKTWDEDKMNELAASIKERGVIVPVKVRPISEVFRECRYHGIDWLEGRQISEHGETCFFCEELRSIHGAYKNWELEEDDELEPGAPFLELVYGHRRAEAARRAGLTEIPAIVEGTDDADALAEALIENIVREDMLPYEKALGLKSLIDITGWTYKQVARSMGWKSEGSVGNLIDMLRPDLEGVAGLQQVEDSMIISQAKAGLGQQQQDALPKIVEKAITQGLSRSETRAVAEAYKAADTPELRDAVLNTSGKLGDPDRILQSARMTAGAGGLVERHEEERRQSFQEYDKAAKDFFDFMKLSRQMVKTARSAAGYGKFSPEAAEFAVRRINDLIDELEALREVLSHVD